MLRPIVPAVFVTFALLLGACQQESRSVDVTAPPRPTPAPGATSTAPPTSTARPTTTSPATWSPMPPCTVSAILVPSCGAWLGATTPARDDRTDYATGLAEYETAAQNQPDILHFYKRDDQPFPTRAEIALAERPGQQRSILFYNWKPSTTLSWREVADGGADLSIDATAERLRAYPRSMFLTLWHEPENDQGVHGTPADFVAMYRHVVGRLRQLGVTNAVYVMNYMGFSQWADVVDDFYPGDDVVDWLAYDPYGFAAHTDLAALLNEPGGTWPGFYSWATRLAPGTPIMLGEWGIDIEHQPLAASILDRGVPMLQRWFPQIKALVYWHDVSSDGVVVRLDHDTPDGLAYADAYRRFANDPYFNSTDPALAP